MKKEFTIEQTAETQWFYHCTETNSKDETLIIELNKNTNSGGKKSLPELWKKHGYMDRVLETYWGIETYVTDTERACYGLYNPQSKLSEDGKRAVINFEWMFEATEENKEKLIDEVFKLFSSATGKTATEEKHRKIREYAKENNIEVVTELPEGWVDLGYCTAPVGSTWVGSSKSFRDRDRDRKKALLLI